MWILVMCFAACASEPPTPLPKGYVCLGLFKNEGSSPVTVTLQRSGGGVYLDMPLEAHQIDRTGIRSTTIAVVTSDSGKRLSKTVLLTPAAMKNYDSAKNTIYYRITASAIESVAPAEGRVWDR